MCATCFVLLGTFCMIGFNYFDINFLVQFPVREREMTKNIMLGCQGSRKNLRGVGGEKI